MRSTTQVHVPMSGLARASELCAAFLDCQQAEASPPHCLIRCVGVGKAFLRNTACALSCVQPTSRLFGTLAAQCGLR